MLGLMQNRPLLISGLVDYAASCHGDREIVSRDPDGLISRTTYAVVAERAKRLMPPWRLWASASASLSQRLPGTASGIWSCIMV